MSALRGADSLRTPTRPKNVQFDLPTDQGGSESPDKHRHNSTDRDGDASDPATPSDGERKRRRHRKHRDRDGGNDNSSSKATAAAPPNSRNAPHQQPRRRSSRDAPTTRPSRPDCLDSNDSAASEETVDLPARFDDQGRRVPARGEDPLADHLEDLVNGSFFRRLTGGWAG